MCPWICELRQYPSSSELLTHVVDHQEEATPPVISKHYTFAMQRALMDRQRFTIMTPVQPNEPISDLKEGSGGAIQPGGNFQEVSAGGLKVTLPQHWSPFMRLTKEE